MIPSGFEPETDRLEICCSIQLSYGTFIRKKKIQEYLNLFVGVAGFEPTTFCSQSRRDTGLRYTPKNYFINYICFQTFSFVKCSFRTFDLPAFLMRDAIPGCATPRKQYSGGEGGIRTPGKGYPLRQFSKLLVSATHPPLLFSKIRCHGSPYHLHFLEAANVHILLLQKSRF